MTIIHLLAGIVSLMITIPLVLGIVYLIPVSILWVIGKTINAIQPHIKKKEEPSE